MKEPLTRLKTEPTVNDHHKLCAKGILYYRATGHFEAKQSPVLFPVISAKYLHLSVGGCRASLGGPACIQPGYHAALQLFMLKPFEGLRSA